jgi:hypothetical protein
VLGLPEKKPPGKDLLSIAQSVAENGMEYISNNHPHYRRKTLFIFVDGFYLSNRL